MARHPSARPSAVPYAGDLPSGELELLVTPSPPAYAWDWFARQRLLWREARKRLADDPTPAGARYRPTETRGEVVPMLRADYPHDDAVRTVVDAVVAEVVFLGRTDRPFATLGARNAPRGLRWWWTALTGEPLDAPPPRRGRGGDEPGEAEQLALGGIDDVLSGYGD